ncbi:MAG TPA: hypothetical protein PLO37_25805, partial [Candidatus Hydrogenedentes bacterium]|nr:hypothetical protein [Candidatus Hydrogenedentota bacterium]HPG70272.1 hypothetical protein [Candidatus Hydrogenedentota bacterium]
GVAAAPRAQNGSLRADLGSGEKVDSLQVGEDNFFKAFEIAYRDFRKHGRFLVLGDNLPLCMALCSIIANEPAQYILLDAGERKTCVSRSQEMET